MYAIAQGHASAARNKNRVKHRPATSKIKVEKGGTKLGELHQGSAFGERAVLGMMSIQLVSIKAGLKRNKIQRKMMQHDAIQYNTGQ